MTKYELSEDHEFLIITSEGGVQYQLYLHYNGVDISRGADGSGGTIYESEWVNFSLISHEIRMYFMWTYIEAAIMAVNNNLIEIFLTDEDASAAISKRKIDIPRFSEMGDIIRTYLDERSDIFETFIDI